MKPTIVLVHGAFADAAGWNDVSLMLLEKGYRVHAWANPLRGLSSDAAYLRDFLSTVDGPIVLVGRSYGGAVITEAATGNEDVEALVYVAAYALDEGENVAQANELGGGHSTVIDNIEVRPYPGAPAGDGDAMVKTDKFGFIFAQDMPRNVVRLMAHSQRPAALSALVIPAGEPGWKTIPSYYLIANNDHLIPPVAQVEMARRADATWRRVNSSHVVMMRRPEATVRYIVRADVEKLDPSPSPQPLTHPRGANRCPTSPPLTAPRSARRIGAPADPSSSPTVGHSTQTAGRRNRTFSQRTGSAPLPTTAEGTAGLPRPGTATTWTPTPTTSPC